MNKISLAAIVLVVATLTGCASASRTEQMAVQTAPADRIIETPMSKNVSVREVTGGKATNPAWVSNVGNPEFQQAIEASLDEAGMLSPGKDVGKYVLVANMEKLEQPMGGFSMTVTATVNYVLSERASGKQVMSQRISLPFTASTSDAFVGATRLRLANEGAIRVNIKRLIEEIRKTGMATVALK
jgi:hypothetical protein